MDLRRQPATIEPVRPRRRPRPDDIRFPADDGVPTVENPHHDENRPLLRNPLRSLLNERGIESFIAGNNPIYWDKDDPQKKVGPDLYFALNVRPSERDCWRMWNEGERPVDVVIEMVSKSSAHKDWVVNMRLYQDVLRVPYYYILDDRRLQRPRHPLLSGFRLEGGRYVPIPPKDGKVWCEPVGLYLGVLDGWLRWFHPNGDLLLTGDERADAAEAEIQRLRRLLDELRPT